MREWIARVVPNDPTHHRLDENRETYQIPQWAPPGVVIEAKDIELSPIVRRWTRRGHRVVFGIRRHHSSTHAIGIHVRAPRRRSIDETIDVYRSSIDTLQGQTRHNEQGTRHETAVCLPRMAIAR